jgi:serine/threonine protein kinase
MAVASTNWLAGAELGQRFTDVRLVRAGSRFTIYEGREVGSNRTLAIKVPDGSGSSPWLYEVAEHEAAVLALVGAHPHIVTLYQRITLDDGRPALLLERCPGTLYDAVHSDEDAMSVREVVAIGIKLAGALETLHRSGVLHCDVRPRTVLVSEWGEPVLAGFDESVDLADLGTRPPMHNLTPHTAPELLEGSDPSPASDVYGLASTLYELAAGRAAFRAYVGESPASVIVRVLSSRAKPVVAPQVPLELTDLISWAMAPDPSNRPPTPAWLAEELGRIEMRQDWPRTRMVGT